VARGPCWPPFGVQHERRPFDGHFLSSDQISALKRNMILGKILKGAAEGEKEARGSPRGTGRRLMSSSRRNRSFKTL